MATQATGRVAALPELPARTARRLPDLGDSRDPAARVDVYDGGDSVIVRAHLADGPVELRIPRTALERARRHPITGCNPDATPC